MLCPLELSGTYRKKSKLIKHPRCLTVLVIGRVKFIKTAAREKFRFASLD